MKNSVDTYYFLGIGGIGMSALVRYFLSEGKFVAGYDRTPSPLTSKLIEEGATLHFEENCELIPNECKEKETTLVVYTPAIPKGHKELEFFAKEGFCIKKRAEVLLELEDNSEVLTCSSCLVVIYICKRKSVTESTLDLRHTSVSSPACKDTTMISTVKISPVVILHILEGSLASTV